MGQQAEDCSDNAATAPDEIRTRFDKTFFISCDKRYLLHNRTPLPIRVKRHRFGEIVVPPLAQRVIRGTRLAPFSDQLRPLRQRHQLRVREYQPPTRGSGLTIGIAIAIAVLMIVVVHDLLRFGTLVRPEAALSLIVVVGLIAAALISANRVEDGRRDIEEIVDTEEGDIEFGMGGAFFDGNETLRRTKQLITLLVVITVGAALPAVAIFVATDAKDFLVMEGGLDVVKGKESPLVGRVIQVLYTAALSLFPALLYFQFDRHRVGTIRSEWVRGIFRMDRRMKTLADVNARYGDELSEASSYSTDTVRLLGGRHSPIIVATLLITLGWTLLVVQTESFDFARSTEVASLAQDADGAAGRANDALDAVQEGGTDLAVGAAVAASARDEAAQASEAADLVAGAPSDQASGAAPATTVPAATDESPSAASVEQDAAAATASAESAAATDARTDPPFFQFLVPTPSAATMAFLGAYFFGMYLLLRSYFRGDLRPKIYNQITARLITVVVLAYLINTLFYEVGGRNEAVWMLSFLAGVVPTTVLRQLGQLTSGLGKKLLPFVTRASRDAFATPRRLTQIDGVDIYESARLETEGITDIPSLVHADMVSVMIKTRLPIEQLVDWTDQAVLILLVGDAENETVDDRITGLRQIGIRTASALMDACADGRRDAAERVLGRARAEGELLTLDALAAAIRQEPAMVPIRQWRESETCAPDAELFELTVDGDGPHLQIVAA